MKNTCIYTCFFFVLSTTSWAQQTDRTYAFTGVNVIPMNDETVLTNQTVISMNGLITKIGDAAEVTVPSNATVIDGQNQYLIPGMADMHAHLPNGGEDEINLKDYLALNVARGITTLRSMRGDEKQLALRDSIMNGSVLGPNLILGSPVLPRDKDLNADKVKELLLMYKDKYDFVKYLYALRPSLYDSMMITAREEGVKVAGHAPKAGIEPAIKGGQTSIEHIDVFIKEYKQDSVKFKKTVALMSRLGIFVCPDIDWYYIYWDQLAADELKKRSGVELLPPSLVAKWISTLEQIRTEKREKNEEKFLAGIASSRQDIDLFLKLLKDLHQVKVPLLISPGDGYFIVPGYSFLNECLHFVKAGISPYETLKAATYNAAAWSGKTSDWGTVEENKQADLVLLESNPLIDIGNLSKINGVMIRGKWLPKKELEKIRDLVGQKALRGE